MNFNNRFHQMNNEFDEIIKINLNFTLTISSFSFYFFSFPFSSWIWKTANEYRNQTQNIILINCLVFDVKWPRTFQNRYAINGDLPANDFRGFSNLNRRMTDNEIYITLEHNIGCVLVCDRNIITQKKNWQNCPAYTKKWKNIEKKYFPSARKCNRRFWKMFGMFSDGTNRMENEKKPYTQNLKLINRI